MISDILLLEWRTLLRGMLITFLIVFPFTFLPVVFAKHHALENFINRIPESFLYSFVFSLVIVGVALASNIDKIRIKKEIFSSPAFRELGFTMRIQGLNSIVAELSPFLIGTYNNVLFKIEIQIDDQRKISVMIVPLISNDGKIKSRHNTHQLNPRPLDFDNPMYLKKHLTVICSRL